ncbi:DedA family inner membrane protein YqjA [Klebsiella pneumoniae]|uniref:DedA family inner membrane protein YqjA n=1 Tax=Klebsiella pneumoniae TaxID=573 RepID=A0A377U0B5_KLEPN|nr:DedA family inner membrane protein YqjA [Klebsiella pneumoniae]
MLVGVLIAKGAMGFPETLLLLTAAASLGCWLSYIQGRWLGNTRIRAKLAVTPAFAHITSVRITCFISMGSPRC